MNAKGALLIAAATRTRETLRDRVPMPSSSTDQGELGQYAVDGDTLAIYVEDKGDGDPGWIFWTGHQR